MKGAAIKSYVYRYFFSPPRADDRAFLDQIAGISSGPEFNVRIGGVHALDDFKTAVAETLDRPESGKRIFKMADL
jgi:NADPH:quinone reductase